MFLGFFGLSEGFGVKSSSFRIQDERTQPPGPTVAALCGLHGVQEDWV